MHKLWGFGQLLDAFIVNWKHDLQMLMLGLEAREMRKKSGNTWCLSKQEGKITERGEGEGICWMLK